MVIQKEKKREWKLDNIKGILIILVVLGHLLELDLNMDYNKYLHVCIYLFHMPAFIFVTGYFAKFSIKNTLKNILYPYLLFQLLYLLFANAIWEKQRSIQLKEPYWIMWYLFALMIWSLLLFLFQEKSNQWKLLLVIGTTILALAIGFVPQVGRTYSLSRIFVFFPFYIAGYYYGKWKINPCDDKYKYVLSWILLMGIILCCGIFYKEVNRNWLYEATDYGKSHYGITFRGMHMGIAFLVIFVLLHLIPNKKIVLLSSLGKNTLSIYLLHGFFVKFAERYEMIKVVQQLPDLLETVALSVMAVTLAILLSRSPVVLVVNMILGKHRNTKNKC